MKVDMINFVIAGLFSDENGTLTAGNRHNSLLLTAEGFNGACPYCKAPQGIQGELSA